MEHLNYLAFATPTGGGNAAGVVLDASGVGDAEMQALAAELGFPETAFLFPQSERAWRIRYFSPQAEVDFCGHATVATAVALAEHGHGGGNFMFETNAGEIPVEVAEGPDGLTATLTSVTPRLGTLEKRDELLALNRWSDADLDEFMPHGLAFGGLWHPILWAKTRDRLSDMEYDFAGLRDLMLAQGWGTVSLLFRESPGLVHARNLFPIGGVVEDPATGAAAAALGGFLRAHALLREDGLVTVLQGEDMGQPCVLQIDASGDGGVRVSGTARRADAAGMPGV